MSTPEAEPEGLRERKNRRTRLAIVRAASELTIEEGYAAATIARIAQRADVAPRTVSTWFPSKDDILFEGADEIVDRGIGFLRDGDGDVVDRLLAWFEVEASGRWDLDPELARLRNDAVQRDPELQARYHQLFARIEAEFAAAAAKDSGAGSANYGPQLFAGAALKFLELLAAHSATADGPPDAARTAEFETGVDYLRKALAAITP